MCYPSHGSMTRKGPSVPDWRPPIHSPRPDQSLALTTLCTPRVCGQRRAKQHLRSPQQTASPDHALPSWHWPVPQHLPVERPSSSVPASPSPTLITTFPCSVCANGRECSHRRAQHTQGPCSCFRSRSGPAFSHWLTPPYLAIATLSSYGNPCPPAPALSMVTTAVCILEGRVWSQGKACWHPCL